MTPRWPRPEVHRALCTKLVKVITVVGPAVKTTRLLCTSLSHQDREMGLVALQIT